MIRPYGGTMDAMLADVRFAFRQLLKHRSFTVVAVLTLALGIGANTAVFSVVYGVLLRQLPFRAPQQLLGFAGTYHGARQEEGVTFGEYQFLARRSAGLADIAASTSVGMNLSSGQQSEHLDGLRVSSGYFHALGVSPMLGRDFSPDEDQEHGPSVVILSYGIWQRLFGGDPSIVGHTVQLDGTPTTVIGVMPRGFVSLPDAAAWSTLAQVGPTVGSGQNLEMLVRRTVMPLALVNARNGAMFNDYHREFARVGSDTAVHLSWVPYTDVMVSDIRTPVTILFGAIGFVLLIACANVASLILGRAATRGRELAVRVALGASRTRIVRQILSESIVLALAGGVAALVVANFGLRALLRLVPSNVPRTDDVHLDGWALLFTFVIALVTGLVFGLIPAWHAARNDPQDSLRESGARSTGSSAQARVRNVLVVGEVALALMLLTGAGLMIRTFANLMRTDAGFDPSHQLAAEIWLTGSRYDTATTVSAYYRDLTSRIDALPGVVSSAVVEAGLPLERGGNMSALLHGQAVGQNDYRTITPGYFATLGVPVVQGRDITATDDAGGAPVMLVSRAFAHHYLHDQAIGQTLSIGGNTVERTVVGVVGDVRSFVGFDPQPTVYLPSAQTPFAFTRVFNGWFPIHVMVKTSGDPALMVNAVRRTIASVDPEIPVGKVETMSHVLSTSLSLQRFLMVLLSVFAGLAIALAMVGIYGLISWFVVRSTREIGVRIALGARQTQVLGLVIGRGMVLTAIGVALGIAGSLALTRLLGSLLYDVKATDPMVFALVAIALALTALLACWIPARRAARVDPLIAMRVE